MSNRNNSSPAYLEWLEEQIFVEVDEKLIKEQLKADLALGKSMSQKEYTLWETWDQIQTIFGDADKETLKNIKRVKRKIWRSNIPDDLLHIEPEVVLTRHEFPIKSVSIWGNERFEFHANPDPLAEDWTILRHFVASMSHGGNIGKSLRFLVRDKKTKKYLGILCLSEAFFDLKGRDDAIGWDQEQKVNQQKVQHTATGSVIVPTQPFGFNYLGGKLLSLLLVSDIVIDTWEQIYGIKLTGIATTSLYGKKRTGTQYDSLKHWKKYGYTAGSPSLRPRMRTESAVREWMRNKHPFEFWRHYKAKRTSGQPLIRDANNRARQFCYKKLGLEKDEHQSDHRRGIYFCKLYSNAFEFLRGEIAESELKPQFDNSVAGLVDLWRERYATKRIKNLIEKDKVSDEPLFYDEFLSSSWDQIMAQRFSK